MGLLTDMECEVCGKALKDGQRVVVVTVDAGVDRLGEQFEADPYPLEQNFYHENCYKKRPSFEERAVEYCESEEFAVQKIVGELIETLTKTIGHKCRGRIEIEWPGWDVVEFESDGKWKTTHWHSKASDDAFSIFPEFKEELPLWRKVKALMNGGK